MKIRQPCELNIRVCGSTALRLSDLAKEMYVTGFGSNAGGLVDASLGGVSTGNQSQRIANALRIGLGNLVAGMFELHQL
jgi:hypothetical protein